MDAQLKRGVLSICILQLLKEKDRYGYDLIKILQKFFPDTEESTLYAILRRLHKEGLTHLYAGGEISHGPPRKYYRLSDQGEKALQEAVSSWQKIETILREIGIPPASL